MCLHSTWLRTTMLACCIRDNTHHCDNTDIKREAYELTGKPPQHPTQTPHPANPCREAPRHSSPVHQHIHQQHPRLPAACRTPLLRRCPAVTSRRCRTAQASGPPTLPRGAQPLWRCPSVPTPSSATSGWQGKSTKWEVGGFMRGEADTLWKCVGWQGCWEGEGGQQTPQQARTGGQAADARAGITMGAAGGTRGVG